MKRRVNYVISVALMWSVSFSVSIAQNETGAGSSEFIKSKAAESITVSELRDHLFFLASDSMKGRKTGTPEFINAAGYCAQKFREAGIKPIYTAQNGEAEYYQDVPYKSINYTRGRIPVLMANDKGLKYAGGLNFRTNIPDDSKSVRTLEVVFAGYGISAPEYGWDDFRDLKVEGKAVLVLNRKPPEELIAKIPEKKRETLLDYQLNISKRKAAAIIQIAETEWILKNWSFSDGLKSQTFFVDNANKSDESAISKSFQLYIKTDVTNQLFKGQPFNPTQRISTGINEYQTFELKGVGLDTSDFTNKKAVFSPNVVGLIKGTDARLSNQYVVIGAHLDHVGGSYNGADDNASGSAGVLEIAEAVAMNPPKRSVLFVLFSGEELNMLGSAYFVNNCPVPIDSVIGMVNLDMIGRTEEKYIKERTHFICNISGATDELLRFTEEVNAETYKWPLMRLTHSGSDHITFAGRGIPSVFFFSGYHKDLHTTEDDPERIDCEKMQVLSQLAYEVVLRLANK